MTDWIYYFNFAAAFSALMAALLGLLLTLTAYYVEPWERRYFRATFLLLLAYAVSDLVAQVSLDFLGPEFTWLSQTGVFCELLFSTMIIPLITAYLLHCADGKPRTSPLFRCVTALWLAYVVVLVVTQFGDAVYCISADNQRVLTGTFYPALFIVPLALMIINVIAFVRRRNALTSRQRKAFAVYTLVPLASVILQAALFDLRIVVVGTNISALAMFGFVLADQMDVYIRQREEAVQRQAQVMALQMRPHFIYNVMTSIYYLCAQDPERAQQVTLSFTDYLRANFDVVAEEGEVPFSKELEHTRAYLDVEQARFEDSLVVDIDCPHKAFRLPPLTLQPLVENAVKHGADPELPPLHVSIETRAEPDFSVITVEDTGPGFSDPQATDNLASETADNEGLEASMDESGFAGRPGSPASALANIRERLTACGATLDITPREGGGTIAIIRVPTRKQVD